VLRARSVITITILFFSITIALLQRQTGAENNSMDTARIAALLEPFLDRKLAPRQLEQISTYIDLLLRWNARINLTAIRNPEEVVTRHFGESFFVARHLFPGSSAHCHPERSQGRGEASDLAESKDPYPSTESGTLGIRVLDLGSGAGFPALPLEIWNPNLHLTLIESNHKKAAFLREVSRALTLTNVDVIAERAETVAERHPPLTADIVTFRAVEKFDQILPIAMSFLSAAGWLAVLIGSSQFPRLESIPDMKWQQKGVQKSQSRVLAIGKRRPQAPD
jgi:16S rRNA (guanine527-N7)-methyltransferase